MNILPISQDGWTSLGSALTYCLIQPNGPARVYIGSVAPIATSPGFFIPSGIPVDLPLVAELGGGVWIKGDEVDGSVVYATA